MTPTLRLGRVFGIEVDVNWSLLFVFALVAWSLTSGLGSQVPGRPAVQYWVAGVAGAVLFYGCLLAHELAHSLVARRQGVRVSGITLWLFGGVSRLEGEPKGAAAEALITFVGPLTSLIVAGLFYALALLVSPGRGASLVADLFAWLAAINLILALFNLVPAFPLDGGRLLSALLWWRTGSRRRGVQLAVRVGRLVAYLMIALGLVELFLGLVVNGVWIAFLGWFLLSAASSEESSAVARDLLRSIPVSNAMSSPVITVPDWLTVEQFLTGVAPSHSFTTYPLHDQHGRLTGVVRLGDLVRGRARRPEARLSEVAHPIAEMPRARPDEDLAGLVERVASELDRRVLVFEGDQLVGIVSPADVARLVALRRRAGARTV